MPKKNNRGWIHMTDKVINLGYDKQQQHIPLEYLCDSREKDKIIEELKEEIKELKEELHEWECSANDI